MADLTKIILLSIFAALVTFLSVPFIRRFAKKAGAVDVPRGRHQHTGAVPLGGGLAIFFGFLLAVLFLNQSSTAVIGYIIGAIIIVGVGFIDDVYELSPIGKLLGQMLAAMVVIACGVQVNFVGNFGHGNDGLYYLGFLSLPFTFFWIVGITNAINLIDGLDGLAGGVSGVASWTLGIVALLSGRYNTAIMCFILGAATFAFLPYNFTNKPNRKMFMGDSGSGFLGYSLAVFSIMGFTKVAAAISILAPIMILAIPIFDTLAASLGRIVSGKSPFEADRRHLHYRIKDKGFSDHQTVLGLYGMTLIFSVLAILSMKVDPSQLWIMFLIAIGVFIGFLSKFRLFSNDPYTHKQ